MVERKQLYRPSPSEQQKYQGTPHTVDVHQNKAVLYRDLMNDLDKKAAAARIPRGVSIGTSEESI